MIARSVSPVLLDPKYGGGVIGQCGVIETPRYQISVRETLDLYH